MAGFAGALAGRSVLVVGAGVAGLAAARACALRGAAVTVLEQADAVRELGAGLQVSPNGARVLRGLGLGEALDAASMPAAGLRLVQGASGATVARLDLAGRDYRFVHRADLIALLRQGAEAAGVTVRLLARAVAVDPAAGSVTTDRGEVLAADHVVGADGLHSVVRQRLNGTVAPFFTHQTAWRAVIPGDPADPAEAEVHLGPGRHLVSYPLRGGTLRNLVAVEERRRWVEEGWATRDDPLALRLAFEGFGPRVRGWLAAVQEVWLWGLFRHPVAPRWHEGRAAILGDAAHPTLPFLAQGANLALEDAWTLAAALDRGGAGALEGWQAVRVPRVTRAIAAAQANARNYHLREPWASLGRAGLAAAAALSPAALLGRFDWLYGHDVTAAG
jgi:salicylate hydroxylase